MEFSSYSFACLYDFPPSKLILCHDSKLDLKHCLHLRNIGCVSWVIIIKAGDGKKITGSSFRGIRNVLILYLVINIQSKIKKKEKKKSLL